MEIKCTDLCSKVIQQEILIQKSQINCWQVEQFHCYILTKIKEKKSKGTPKFTKQNRNQEWRNNKIGINHWTSNLL